MLGIKKHIIFILLGIAQYGFGQVGIGTTSPDSSAIVEVYSVERGVLAPRMTTAQRDAIVMPARGLILYNSSDDCLQTNTGSPVAPIWTCLGTTVSSGAVVLADCDVNGFEGTYIQSIPLTASNKFSLTITNNTFSDADISFTVEDLVLSGVSGISVSGVSPTSITLSSGVSQVVEYTLTGTPSSSGVLTGTWTKHSLNCTRATDIISGDAMFTLSQIEYVVSTSEGTPLQGVVDNGSNQIVFTIPYTSGVGTYDAFTGSYVLNNSGSAEGGDANSFRVTYSAGAFLASGSITATLEVDGDGTFNAAQQLYGLLDTIVTLGFQVNGLNKGDLHVGIMGGIPDRNFADANHKFMYWPVTAGDGNVWLNNNLGANYANINHASYNPFQQATSTSDHDAYGSMFQWGRYSDGHELMNYTGPFIGAGVNGTTTVNATTDTPGDNLFITETVVPNDWRIPSNDLLWQGEVGINNPCPSGFRLPTWTEWNTWLTAESVGDEFDANTSLLKLSLPGDRIAADGTLEDIGFLTRYHSSTVSGGNVSKLELDGGAGVDQDPRAVGDPVRCIKD